MKALRRQYFFSYAVIGSVMPLVSVFLREQGGFDYWQVGLAMALMNLPTLCSPSLITLLADRNVDTRRIMAVAFSCSAVVLLGLYFSKSIVLSLSLFFLYGLSIVAMLPLQDGYFFGLSQQMKRRGLATPDYPLMRIWGTMGFILPSLILYVPLARGATASSILPCAVVFCLFSFANSFTLEKVNPPPQKSQSKMPTSMALEAIFGRRARWLSIGLFFGFMGASTYYAFIGNYLDETMKISAKHIGLIFNLGVAAEIVFTLWMPWLQRKIHLKGVIVWGLFAMMVRMGAIALYPVPWVAMAFQVCHGLETLALFVGPVMFFNRLATDDCRNSIQGGFTMVVIGLGRVAGAVVAGYVVMKWGLSVGLVYGAILSGIACVIVMCLFRRIPPQDEIEVSS